MVEFTLAPHPDFPSAAIDSIGVEVRREAGERLDLEFRVAGAIDRVAWPEWLGVGFADGLWEHSCFEAFVGVPDVPGYAEFNFATSGRWAAYRFDDYRRGTRPVEDALLAGGRTIGTREFAMRRSVRVAGLGDDDVWRLGLSAVIETTDGGKSYWALAHPAGRPDFHDAVCFAARLAAPTRA
ncbi:MAG TPA: DOMON-like domain-containing protein [Sphingomonas sp.]|nr:DOMON-like domain-containing protein [Sphingomonas sp.]